MTFFRCFDTLLRSRIINEFLKGDFTAWCFMFIIFSFKQAAFRTKGIRVNCVCPGSTDTNIYKAMENLDLTEKQQELVSNIPKQR